MSFLSKKIVFRNMRQSELFIEFLNAAEFGKHTLVTPLDLIPFTAADGESVHVTFPYSEATKKTYGISYSQGFGKRGCGVYFSSKKIDEPLDEIRREINLFRVESVPGERYIYCHTQEIRKVLVRMFDEVKSTVQINTYYRSIPIYDLTGCVLHCLMSPEMFNLLQYLIPRSDLQGINISSMDNDIAGMNGKVYSIMLSQPVDNQTNLHGVRPKIKHSSIITEFQLYMTSLPGTKAYNKGDFVYYGGPNVYGHMCIIAICMGLNYTIRISTEYRSTRRFANLLGF